MSSAPRPWCFPQAWHTVRPARSTRGEQGGAMPDVFFYKSKPAEYLDDFYSGDHRPVADAYTDAEALFNTYRADLSDTTDDLNRRTGAQHLPNDVASKQSFITEWLTGKYG